MYGARWLLKMGKRWNQLTGPSRDHTTGLETGHYVTLSSVRLPGGSKARLVSPVFRATADADQSTCQFRFFFHMYGRTPSTLRILLRTALHGQETVVFERSTNSGDFWQRADVDITAALSGGEEGPRMGAPFELVIEGTVGRGIQGDIGLDDTSFTSTCLPLDDSFKLPEGTTHAPPSTTPSACGEQFRCNTGSKEGFLQCVPQSKVCNFQKDCDDGSDEDQCGTCSFDAYDGNWCGYRDVSTGATTWQRINALSKRNPSDGPRSDHTTNSAYEHFLSALARPDASELLFHDDTVLLGPPVKETSIFCKITLWIFMSNTSSTSLHFSFVNSIDPTETVEMRSVRGSNSTDWRQLVIKVGAFSANYQLRIVAESAQDVYRNSSLISIDDIAFVDCNPYAPPLEQNTSMACDFEYDMCNFFHDHTAKLQWTREATSNFGTGPTAGHSNEYFAHLSSHYPHRTGQSGRFFSPIQPPTGNQSVCVHFWYFMYGSQIGELNVYLDQHPAGHIEPVHTYRLLWRRTMSQGNRWLEATRTIDSNVPWKLTFEGIVGKKVITYTKISPNPPF